LPGTQLSSSSGSSTPKKQKPTNKKPVSKQAIEVLQRNIIAYKEALLNMEIGNLDSGRQISDQDMYNTDFSHGELFQRNSPNIQKHLLNKKEYNNDQAKKEILGGTVPIGNFLLKNFIPKNFLEFSDTDVEEKQRINTQEGGMARVPTFFSQVIDTIGRVGTPKIERPLSKNEEKLNSELLSIKNKYKNDNKFFKILQEKVKKDYIEFTKINPKDYNEDLFKKEDINDNILIKYDLNYKYKFDQLSKLKSRLDDEFAKKQPKTEGEESIDGIFHIRTLNALKAIAACSKGFLDFSKSISNTELSIDDNLLNVYNKILENFEKIIYGKTRHNIELDVKLKVIDGLSNLVGKQVDFLSQFKSIIESPNVKELINQTNSFMSIKTSTQAPPDHIQQEEAINNIKSNMSPDHVTVFNEYKNYKLSTLNISGKQFNVTFNDLLSVDSLKKLFKTTFNTQPDKNQLQWFLSQIKQQLTSHLPIQPLSRDPTVNTKDFASEERVKSNTNNIDKK